MALILSNQQKQSKYELATEGKHLGEIVSVKQIQQDSLRYGPQSKIQFLWLCLDQKDSTGKWVPLVQRYSPSLHEKSNLRKLLAQLGVTSPENYDLERLKHVKADIIVTHALIGEKVYANISTIVPGTVLWPEQDTDEVF